MLALAVLLVLTMSASAQDEPASRPDIVVLYLDDVDPHDARLWKNPARTPTLSRLFGKAGVQFTNAVSETPLCSPGRAAVASSLGPIVSRAIAAPTDNPSGYARSRTHLLRPTRRGIPLARSQKSPASGTGPSTGVR